MNERDFTWSARWIAAPDGDGRLPLFRKTFRLAGRPARAVVRVCGLGHFELRINGAKAGEDLLEPGWTCYARRCLYVKRDVTAMLLPDENVVGVMLGNGMYNVAGGRYAKFKGSFGTPKLILQLDVQLADGTATISSDASWRTAPGPITFSCIYGGEDHDARLEDSGWDAPGFDDSRWRPALVVDGPGGALVPQDFPPVRAMQTVGPIRVSEPSAGVRVYDLGRNFSGVPAIGVQGPAGTSVKLITGELLDDTGRVTQENTGSPVSFSYTLRGRGVETWQPRFSYTGFRYVQAEGDVAALRSLEGRWTHAAVRTVGTFACSNDLLNRIHDLILSAVRSNLQSILTDCPHREKLGWLEQTHLMGPSIMCNFDVSRLYAKICADMRDAQRDDGCVPTIAPQYTSFKAPWDVFDDSPEWGSAIVLCPWLAYRQYGDRDIVAENYDAMRRYVRYLDGRAGPDGLIDYGLGDWYDIGPGDPGFSRLTPRALTATAIHYADLRVMAQAAEMLGKADDAAAYRAMARRTRQAFVARRFEPSSQTACAMPLALGLSEDPALLDRLVADIRRHENHTTAGDIGFAYVLAALAEGGRSDVIFDMLSRTDPPSYGCQLERGATALTEAWDANPRKSQNHLMLGHAEAWFCQWLAGIQIDLSQPPGRQITIRPTPVGDVVWAAAMHDSVLGPIAVRWERAGMRIRYHITVPAPATVCLPDGTVRQVPSGDLAI